MDRSGLFTAKLAVAGYSYAFKGEFPLDQPFTTTLTLPRKPAVTVSIEPFTDVIPGFVGTVSYSIGGSDYNGAFDSGPNFLNVFHSELAGAYTVVFGNGFSDGGVTVALSPSDIPVVPTAPSFSGYGVIRISKTGQASVSGKLDDGTSISSSTYLQLTDLTGPTDAGFDVLPASLPIYASLHSARGSFVGKLDVAASAQDVGLPEGQFYILQGGADWFDNSGRADGSTHASLQAVGSTYITPKRGQPPIFTSFDTAGSLDLEAFSNAEGPVYSAFGQIGGFPVAGPFNATFDKGSGPVNLTIQTSNGQYTGSFIDPVTRKRASFTGVFVTLPFYPSDFPFGVGFYHSGKDAGQVLLFGDVPN
jgi:hypothetical protein